MYRIITRVAGLSHSYDHTEEDKQEREDQLGHNSSIETSEVVESLQKHGNKLLEPKKYPSVGNYMHVQKKREREKEEEGSTDRLWKCYLIHLGPPWPPSPVGGEEGKVERLWYTISTWLHSVDIPKREREYN